MRELDISNGEGVGVSLFVQGCPFHCKNCFNQETWEYDNGKEWTNEIKDVFLKLIDRPYIKRITLLGGDPLYGKNLDGILDLCNIIKSKCKSKTIWIYSGYKFEDIFNDSGNAINFIDMLKRQQILKLCDVMIDGQFIDELKDLNLKFRGSSNQRIIDIKESLKQSEVVLWKE